jgi:type I restriction enzyme S subunit
MKIDLFDELPEGWEWKRLGDVCIIIAGQSPKSDTYNTEKIGFPFYQGKMDFGIEFPTPRIWCSAPIKIAIKDDILLSVRAPVGPTNMANENCCIGRGLCAIRANSDIDKSYLKAYFRMFESDIAKMGSGSIFQAITTEDVKDLTIPLPPFDEQRRIAAIIEKKLASVEKAKKAAAEQQEAAEALAKAYLREVFKFDELPEGWEWKRLGDVCNLYQPKTIISQEIKCEGKYKVFGANGVIGFHDKYNHEYAEVAITCRGATCGTVNYTEPKSWITGNAMVVCPKDNDVNRKYLLYVLGFFDLSDTITGTAQPQITKTTLEPFKIPLPPLSEQRRIAAIIEKKLESVTKLKTHLAEQAEVINALPAAILRKAFAGEI